MNEYKDYWYNYFNKNEIINTAEPQKNVGRTRNRIAVDQNTWDKTIQYIISILGSLEDKTILELCCGNGMVIGNIAPYCKKAVGIDYSENLLLQLNRIFPGLIHSIKGDVMELDLKKELYDIIIIYFSIQHFSNEETIKLIQKAYNSIVPGGKIFIGDIPNELSKWEYINLKNHKIDYIQRILDKRPMIGNWFHPLFFEAISEFLGCNKFEILKQPDYLINSSHRFDVIFHKNKT